jgi:hypothetical protein
MGKTDVGNVKYLTLALQEHLLYLYSMLKTQEEKEMLFNSIKRIHELCSCDCNQNENMV